MTSNENSSYATDEIKIYVDEGEEIDENKIAENLNEDKKQLVGDSEDEEERSARPKESSKLSLYPGFGESQFTPPFLYYPGFHPHLAQFSLNHGKDLSISSPMPMGYPAFPPPAHQGFFNVPHPSDMLKWAALTRFHMFPNGFPGGPLPPIPPFTPPSLNPLHKIPHPNIEGHDDSLRIHLMNHHDGFHNTDPHLPNTSYTTYPKAAPKKPAVKKPLNAFMLFLKENRPAAISKHNSKESATINKMLASEWRSLDKSAQQKYYDLAKKEKESHALKYPTWSARDNYAMNSKKKKKA